VSSAARRERDGNPGAWGSGDLLLPERLVSDSRMTEVMKLFAVAAVKDSGKRF
jgi:hypothetical protein